MKNTFTSKCYRYGIQLPVGGQRKYFHMSQLKRLGSVTVSIKKNHSFKWSCVAKARAPTLDVGCHQ